jgi:hypothetical protein
VITVLVVDLLAMSACLELQALASVLAARYFARAVKQPLDRKPCRAILLQFLTVSGPRRISPPRRMQVEILHAASALQRPD